MLARAVAYKNLSGAASNVGISQPQLSRIVSRLEGSLDVVLLDRSSRRNSGWTPVAFKLAELYSRATRNIEAEISKLVGEPQGATFKIGTLEGLSTLALGFAHQLFAAGSVRRVELDVHDLSRIEEIFFKGELDFIFVSREPGRKKFRNTRLLGYQSLDRIESSKATLVMSAFEHQTHAKDLPEEGFERLLVSNSLAIRRQWIETYGGTGVIPQPMKREKPASGRRIDSVFLVGSDLLQPAVWARIQKFKF